MRHRLDRTLIALAFGSAVAACGAEPEAPGGEGESTDALSWRGGSEIRISRNDLGREYLLQASLIDQDQANFSFGLESKIVRFQLNNGELLMLRAGDGLTTGDNYDAAIASFPIVFEGQRSIGFDFNKGMQTAYAYSSDWHVSDTLEQFFGFPYDRVPFELHETFISDARAAGNRFIIEQAAQADFGGVRYPHVIKYYLTPYAPSSTYVPLPSPGHDIVSFFEAAPRLDDRGTQVYRVARFDPTRRVRYAISDAVPAEFRDAVRDGIEYWNTALGRNFIIVEDAPAGTHAPDQDRNIIEWIKWDDAGFAYADGQVDPRTGELLHAQVFMTSSWAIYARDQVFALTAKLAADEGALESDGRTPAERFGALVRGSKGRKSALGGKLGEALAAREGFADVRAFRSHLRGLVRLIEGGASEAVMLEAARDVIRTVIAHEVGHTLGLRHNFIGSVSANYTAADVDGLATAYVENGGSAPAGLITGATVMDYATTLDDMLTGYLVQKDIALSYDQVAIAALYDGVTATSAGTPPICNDSAWGEGFIFEGINSVDCQLWDGGQTILEAALIEKDNLLRSAISDLLATAVAYKTDLDHPKPVEAATADPALYGSLAVFGGSTTHLGFSEVISQYYDIADVWGPAVSAPLVAAQQISTYPTIGELELDDLTATRDADIAAEVAAHGGLAALVAPIDQAWIDDQQLRLDNLLAQTGIVKGTAPNGLAYTLTPAEIDAIRAKGRELVAEMPKHYFSAMVTATNFFDIPRGGANLQELAAGRARLARDGVFAVTHEVLTASVTLTSSNGLSISRMVEVGVPLYQQADRLTAVGLLTGEAPESDWVTAACDDLTAEIDQLILDTFGLPRADVETQVDTIPHPVRRWTQDLLALSCGAIF